MNRLAILLSPLLALGLVLTAQGAPSPESESESQRSQWFDSRAVGGHTLRMLSDGKSLEEARMGLVREATKSIYISGYAFGDGGNWTIETPFLAALCARAKDDQIDIRVLADNHGSKKARAFVEDLRDCGVKVLFFNPLRWGIDDATNILHEKLMIVDGERYIIGGSGYSDNYHSHGRDSGIWYDLDLLVEGPTACQFQRKFGESWLRSIKQDVPSLGGMPALMQFGRLYGSFRLESCEEKESAEGSSRILPIHNNPFFSSRRPLIDTYVEAINASKTKIRLYAPYFAPHPRFTHAIVNAIRRGVDVEIFTNSVRSSDESEFVILGMYYTAQKIVNAGAEAGRQGKVMMWDADWTLHRKGGVFDGKWALFGSDNMDRRGQDLSSESVVLTDDAEIVARLSHEMEDDHKYLRVLTKREIIDHFKGAPDLIKLLAAWARRQF